MKQLSIFENTQTEIRLDNLYLLNGLFLKCTKIRGSGINTFRVCDDKGVIKPIIRNDKGHIIEYGIRLIKYKTNELKIVLNC